MFMNRVAGGFILFMLILSKNFPQERQVARSRLQTGWIYWADDGMVEQQRTAKNESGGQQGY